MATALRTASKRIGDRVLRPSLAAAAAVQHPQPERARFVHTQTEMSSEFQEMKDLVSQASRGLLLHRTPSSIRQINKGLIKGSAPFPMSAIPLVVRSFTSNAVALDPTNPDPLKTFHLEVAGKLLPVLGTTNQSVYKISFCSNNAEHAGNLVRDFAKALQSSSPDNVKKFLSDQIPMVEIQRLVSGGAMEVKLQSLEQTVEIRFELETLKNVVLDEGISTRKELQALQKQLAEVDVVKAVFTGILVNGVVAFLCYLAGQITNVAMMESLTAMSEWVSA